MVVLCCRPGADGTASPYCALYVTDGLKNAIVPPTTDEAVSAGSINGAMNALVPEKVDSRFAVDRASNEPGVGAAGPVGGTHELKLRC